MASILKSVLKCLSIPCFNPSIQVNVLPLNDDTLLRALGIGVMFSFKFISEVWKAITSPLQCNSLSVPSPIITSPFPFGESVILLLVPLVDEMVLPSILILSICATPLTVKVVPLNVRFASAFASAPPDDVITLLLPAFVKLLIATVTVLNVLSPDLK